MEKTKKENDKQMIDEHIANGEWEYVLSYLADQIPQERLSLLWEIAMLADWKNLDMLEEKIYSYGGSLGSKDYIGRVVFTRMVQALSWARRAAE